MSKIWTPKQQTSLHLELSKKNFRFSTMVNEIKVIFFERGKLGVKTLSFVIQVQHEYGCKRYPTSIPWVSFPMEIWTQDQHRLLHSVM
jgi:hypothetical protein